MSCRYVAAKIGSLCGHRDEEPPATPAHSADHSQNQNVNTVISEGPRVTGAITRNKVLGPEQPCGS
ncbi:unnamed protein product [Natator depressus]